MALSNIGREPRREITEQIVGLVALTAFLGVDYLIVNKLCSDGWAWKIYWMFLGAFGLGFAAYLLTVVLHEFGETVCGWMSNIGFDPRPKQRNR